MNIGGLKIHGATQIPDTLGRRGYGKVSPNDTRGKGGLDKVSPNDTKEKVGLETPLLWGVLFWAFVFVLNLIWEWEHRGKF